MSRYCCPSEGHSLPQPDTTLRSLLALADYRRLWAIGAGVGIGRWLEMLAMGIYVFQITQSPSLVALVSTIWIASGCW